MVAPRPECRIFRRRPERLLGAAINGSAWKRQKKLQPPRPPRGACGGASTRIVLEVEGRPALGSGSRTVGVFATVGDRAHQCRENEGRQRWPDVCGTHHASLNLIGLLTQRGFHDESDED